MKTRMLKGELEEAAPPSSSHGEGSITEHLAMSASMVILLLMLAA